MKMTKIEELPPEVVRACYELVAQCLRDNSIMLTIDLGEVSHAGQPVGDYSITVTKVIKDHSPPRN